MQPVQLTRRRELGPTLALALSLMLGLAAGPALAKDQEFCDDRARQEHEEYMKTFREIVASKNLGKATIAKALAKRDKEVRAHEQEHHRSAGSWAAKLIYHYQLHAGKRYVVSGCVKFKVDAPGNVLILSALAPRIPSSHDIVLANEIAAKLAENEEAITACGNPNVRRFLTACRTSQSGGVRRGTKR